MTLTRLSGWVGLAVLLMLPGCGSGTVKRSEAAPVSGTLTFRGKALTRGNILFVPSGSPERPPATGSIGADGAYALHLPDGRTGAEPGDYHVAVTEESDNGFDQGTPGRPKATLPNRFADPERSQLTATVKPGSNTLNFDLTN